MLDQKPIKNTDYSKNIQYQVNELELQLINSQTEHSRNESLYRTYGYHLEKLDLINKLIHKSKRFNWLQIQLEMDRLYKKDPSITGYIIHFDFMDCILKKRALIKYRTYSQKQ